MLLRPSGDALAIELLFYPEDVRISTQEEIEEVVHDTKVAKAELDMAKQLVESLSRPFEPDEFENEHKRDLMALIEKKLAGEEIERRAGARGAPAGAGPDGRAAGLARAGQGRQAQGRRQARGAPRRRRPRRDGAKAKKTKSRARAKTKA